MRLFLTETVELVLGQATLEECTRIHTGSGMSLIEDLVSATRMIGTAEEVVVADLVEGSAGRIGADVAADTDTGALRSVHHDGRVPPNPRTVLTLDVLVTGESGLILRRNRVEVIRRRNHRHGEMQFLRTLEQ